MKKPNILFLFTDDQRFDTIGALNNNQILTPNMDKLVKRGISFSNTYIMGGQHGAICCPSRAMLMTGRTMNNLPRSVWEPWLVADSEAGDCPYETFPETFRKAGYSTFATGKQHNGTKIFSRGFANADRLYFGGMSDHFKVPLNSFDPEGIYSLNSIHFEEKLHSTDLFSSSACDFLNAHDGESPFLMYVSYTSPHDPRDTHQCYHDMYKTDEINLPENFMTEHPFDNGDLVIRDEMLAGFPRDPAEVRSHIAAYYAMITHIDHRIGDILDTLEKTGQADNTIIVLAGDNGLAVGRHGLMGKQNLYDHSMHVPLIMSGPGIPQNKEHDTYCYLLDIFPTLCDLAGLETPESVEGISLVPAFDDPTFKARKKLYFSYANYQRAVQDERWKLIEYCVNGVRTTQLFDMLNDQFELNDLSDQREQQDNLLRMRDELRKWQTELNDTTELGVDFWNTIDQNK